MATMTNTAHTQDHKFAYSVEEAADLLSVKRDTVYELINSKQLGSFKIGADGSSPGSTLRSLSRPRSPSVRSTSWR